MSTFHPKSGTTAKTLPSITLRCTQAMYAKLGDAAKAANLSKCALVRQMVDHCLSDNAPAKPSAT